MIQSQVYKAISGATTALSNYWLLSFSGLAVAAETVTIGGVVFTSVTPIGTTAGNVLIGATASACATNLANAINNYGTTDATHVKLSAADCATFGALNLRAVALGATVALQSATPQNLTVSETQDNASWGSNIFCSDPIPTHAWEKGSIEFMGTGIASGNGVFTVEVSNDGTNWAAYNRLISNVTNTNAQTDTRVASVTVNSNVPSVATFPTSDAFAFLRVKVVVTTDGTYAANVLVA